MSKIRRSERLIDMTFYLLERPNTLISLSNFVERYDSAKSSISEDIGIIRRTFMMRGIGMLETLPGAGGGVLYTPSISKDESQKFLNDIKNEIAQIDRILPGGYLYLSDLLTNPEILKTIGRMIATQYADSSIDVVMTVATKGIPIAQSVANYLNVPFVIVRRDSKITEGSTISVNYASESSDRIQKMELSKRSLKAGSNVLVVDDFMKGGGTIIGMKSLIEEFDANYIGATVFVENSTTSNNVSENSITSMFKVNEIDPNKKSVSIDEGNFIENTNFNYFE